MNKQQRKELEALNSKLDAVATILRDDIVTLGMDFEPEDDINALVAQMLARIVKDFVPILEDVRDDIDTLKSDEESKYDNMPESLQNTERGEQMEAGIDALQNAYAALDGVVDQLQTASVTSFSLEMLTDHLDSWCDEIDDAMEHICDVIYD